MASTPADRHSLSLRSPPIDHWRKEPPRELLGSHPPTRRIVPVARGTWATVTAAVSSSRQKAAPKQGTATGEGASPSPATGYTEHAAPRIQSCVAIVAALPDPSEVWTTSRAAVLQCIRRRTALECAPYAAADPDRFGTTSRTTHVNLHPALIRDISRGADFVPHDKETALRPADGNVEVPSPAFDEERTRSDGRSKPEQCYLLRTSTLRPNVRPLESTYRTHYATPRPLSPQQGRPDEEFEDAPRGDPSATTYTAHFQDVHHLAAIQPSQRKMHHFVYHHGTRQQPRLKPLRRAIGPDQ